MDVRDTPHEAAFRSEIRQWLADHLVGEFAAIGNTRGTADDSHWDLRMEWERMLGRAGWIGLSWPKEYGGRGATFLEQAIFAEEYARSDAPGRVTFLGEGLLAPTLIAHGIDAQKLRFLPGILAATELWCQGFSEPNAGSDLANVATKAVLDGDEWVINGQKVWTTFAHHADWCFLLARTDLSAPVHKGITYLLVPMDQPGVTVRPLRQMTGSAEFNEVFFDDARTSADMVVGKVGAGWGVAMATLGFERGTALLGLQLAFEQEWRKVVETARRNGIIEDATIRQRLARAFAEIRIMGYNSRRSQTSIARAGTVGPEASIAKLYWSTWHRNLGELALDVLGPVGTLVPDAEPGQYHLDDMQRSALFARSETIYAGASEIQKNIISERVLGLPR